MIEYRELSKENIIEISVDGKITAEEYHQVAEKCLSFLEQHPKVRILKEIRNLQGFDLSILKERLLADLLKHRDAFTHAAVVSDEPWIEQLSRLFSPTFRCEARYFKLAEIEQAREWLSSAPDRQPQIQVMPESQGNILCLQVRSKLTHEDYAEVLIPSLENIIRAHGRARLLVDFGEVFHGIELTAVWDDTTFGIKHRDDFEKVAVVGGPRWIDWASMLASKWMSSEVETFPPYQLDEALEWIQQPILARRGVN